LPQKSSDILWRVFFGRGISGEALLVYNFVPGNWLWSGFINPSPPFGFFSFPRKESFDLNRKKKAPKKRTRFDSNDQLSIHFTRLLDYLK